jgi:hypothetical protein
MADARETQGCGSGLVVKPKLQRGPVLKWTRSASRSECSASMVAQQYVSSAKLVYFLPTVMSPDVRLDGHAVHRRAEEDRADHRVETPPPSGCRAHRIHGARIGPGRLVALGCNEPWIVTPDRPGGGRGRGEGHRLRLASAVGGNLTGAPDGV